MKYRMALALTLAVTLVAPSAAFADKPLREVLPLQPDIVTQRCGFPVLVHSEGQIVRSTWFDEDGNPVRAVETYPGLKYVLTNLVTQEHGCGALGGCGSPPPSAIPSGPRIVLVGGSGRTVG